MIRINYLKSIFSKDFIEFLLLNFIFVDSFLSLIIPICISLVYVLFLNNHVDSGIASKGSMIVDLILFLLIMIFKIFSLVLYYKIDYNKTTNTLIINFFEILKLNTKNKIIWLCILFMPYLLLALFEAMNLSYNIVTFFQELLFCIIFGFFVSGVISYCSLFIYWHLEKDN